MNELDAYVEVRSSTPAPKRGVTPRAVGIAVEDAADHAGRRLERDHQGGSQRL